VAAGPPNFARMSPRRTVGEKLRVVMVAAICNFDRAAAPSVSECAGHSLVFQGGGNGHTAEQSASSQDNA
jgi:hypothetical protein